LKFSSRDSFELIETVFFNHIRETEGNMFCAITRQTIVIY